MDGGRIQDDDSRGEECVELNENKENPWGLEMSYILIRCRHMQNSVRLYTEGQLSRVRILWHALHLNNTLKFKVRLEDDNNIKYKC